MVTCILQSIFTALMNVQKIWRDSRSPGFPVIQWLPAVDPSPLTVRYQLGLSKMDSLL